MNDERGHSLAERYGVTPTHSVPEPESRAFSKVSANRGFVIMLDLRFKTGDCVALPYSFLNVIQFSRSRGIRLSFGGHKVTVTGRNLEPLYRGLRDHRITWIQESEEALDVGGADETVVARLQLEES